LQFDILLLPDCTSPNVIDLAFLVGASSSQNWNDMKLFVNTIINNFDNVGSNSNVRIAFVYYNSNTNTQFHFTWYGDKNSITSSVTSTSYSNDSPSNLAGALDYVRTQVSDHVKTLQLFGTDMAFCKVVQSLVARW
jgi:hypothetical protein